MNKILYTLLVCLTAIVISTIGVLTAIWIWYIINKQLMLNVPALMALHVSLALAVLIWLGFAPLRGGNHEMSKLRN